MLTKIDLNDHRAFYQEYYTRQNGHGLAVYSGRRIMDGDGIGALFRGAFKALAPSLKRLGGAAVRSLGKHAVGALGNVLDGRSFKESALNGVRGVGGDVFREVTGGGSRKRNAPSRRPAKKRQRGRGGDSIFDL